MAKGQSIQGRGLKQEHFDHRSSSLAVSALWLLSGGWDGEAAEMGRRPVSRTFIVPTGQINDHCRIAEPISSYSDANILCL